MSNAVALRSDTAVATSDLSAQAIEDVLIRGNLKNLTEAQRLTYYRQVCKSTGLNPLTQPFSYLELDGKLVLYAKRDAADQLRKINGISIEIVDKKIGNGLVTVHVRATDKTGRKDEDMGAVEIPRTDKALANAILKAITKAKRRVTLSISGLGFLDETEVEDIESNNKREVYTAQVVQGSIDSPPQVKLVQSEPAPAPRQTIQDAADSAPMDPDTGEVSPHAIRVEKTSDGKESWIAWGPKFLFAVGNAKSDAEIQQWIGMNRATLDALKAASPKFHARLSNVTAECRAKLSNGSVQDDALPAFLDRRPEDEHFIADTDAEFAKAATLDELDAVWGRVEPAVIQKSRSTRDQIAGCYEGHVRRIKDTE